MVDLLHIRVDDHVRVRFLHHHTSFEVRHIHFVRGDSTSKYTWKEEACAGAHCQRCLAGLRVTTRFIARVKDVDNRRERVLQMPHSLYASLLPHFYDDAYRVNSTVLEIHREPPCGMAKPFYRVKRGAN